MIKNFDDILRQLPYSKPFLFVDTLTHIDEAGAKGHFTFSEDLVFYIGHFKDHPITPGVLLTECCAQIGLVCLGLYLGQSRGDSDPKPTTVAMTSSTMEFLRPVYPGETVTVTSEKVYFRFHKLKCNVKMHDAEGRMICKGVISGMLKTQADA